VAIRVFLASKEDPMDTAISQDGTAIAYDQVGAGAPVILVGGALDTRAHPRFTGLAALLAPQFTVITYDRRGRGDSGDTPPYATEREVEDLAALFAAAGGSASLFGMSSGGILAIEAAARGLAVTKLAVYEPPFIVDDNDRQATSQIAAQLTERLAKGDRGGAVSFWLGMSTPPDALAAMRAEPAWASFEALAHTLAYDLTIVRDALSADPLPAAATARPASATAARWAAATMPALALDGAESPWWVGDHAVGTLTETLPNARRRTLARQGGDVDPAALAPVLIEFFAG
jgi:pimeloyl-ACP methyl ester carboxylesterase